MAVTRFERTIGGRRIMFVVNLTTHPSRKKILQPPILLLPDDIKYHEAFDLVVNEGAGTGSARAQETPRHAKKVIYPEMQLCNELMAEVIQALPPQERRALKDVVSTQIPEVTEAATADLYGRADKKILKRDQIKKTALWYATTFIPSSLMAYRGLKHAVPEIVRRLRGTKEMSRRSFLGHLLLGTLGVSMLKASWDINPVSSGLPPRKYKRKTISPDDIEFLRSRISSTLFPTLIKTGRSAFLAESAVQNAKSLPKTPEPAKILISTGAGHADILYFLQHDIPRERRVEWYRDSMKKKIQPAVRAALPKFIRDMQERLKPFKKAKKHRESRRAPTRREFLRKSALRSGKAGRRRA